MKALIAVVTLAALVVVMLWLQGTFDAGKIGPGSAVRAAEPAAAARTATVRRAVVPVHAEAVGTVRSRRTTRVSPRIMGTILEVRAEVGTPVKRDALLAMIDVREAEARLAAARAGLAQAEAVYVRASAEMRRTSELFAKKAATQEALESATADHDTAKAALDGAAEAVKGAEIVVSYAEIRAPLDGVVAEKLAEPGDLALPGRPILVLSDPADLRLEAEVREYLTPLLNVGTPVEVVFGAPLDETHVTQVEERAPEADPATRTFRVKAPLPAGSRARPGNFGRLRFAAGERETILIPAAAVTRLGQLETVVVAAEGRLAVRHVRTGAAVGDELEVLSGLAEGEEVVVR